MKKKICLILITGMICLVFIGIPKVQANFSPYYYYVSLSGGIYIAAEKPVYLKNASVEIDCYENLVLGYGNYYIKNLAPSNVFLTIYFDHFLESRNTGSNITSIRLNGTEIEFSYWAHYTSVAFFDLIFNPSSTINLEVTWEYIPTFLSKLMLGYSIFAGGWSQSIEYESVEFRFHSDRYYNIDTINLYSSDNNFVMEIFSETSETDYNRGLRRLRRACSPVSLTQTNDYSSYLYEDTSISENHFLIITDPPISALKPLEWFFWILASVIGMSISRVVGMRISNQFLTKRVLNPQKKTNEMGK